MGRGPLVTLLAAALVVGAAACGGGGGSPASQRPTTPSPGAPTNVIAVLGRDASGVSHIYLVQPGGTRRQLAINAPGTVFSSPRWSPDGSQLAFVVERRATQELWVATDFEPGGFTTVTVRLLVNDLGSPMSWSPDGKSLAFIENADGGRLRILTFGGGLSDIFAAFPAVAVDWSPAGDRLAIVRADAPQHSAVYTVNPDGSDERLVAESDGLSGGPAWSPGGDRIAVWSAPSAQLTSRTLAVYAPNGDKVSDIGPGTDPAWSADGALAYSRPSTGDPGASFDIYVVPDEGAEPQLAAHSLTLNRWPSWSPDGESIAHLAEADRDTAFVCTITIATEDQNCLDLPGVLPAAPAWSPF